jgi:prefoldin subunit 5
MSAAVKQIPLTEPSDNPRKIPQAVFIDNTEAWVEKYGGDELIANMNELYQKYKFMENQLIRGRESLRVKTPDIRKTLEMVRMLKDKHEKTESLQTNFLISDNVWAKATIPNDTGKVGLWLGANVMVEYTYEEALGLLEKNMSNAEIRIKSTEEDLNFLKDQITTTEVNIARCYNQTVANNQKAKATEGTEGK